MYRIILLLISLMLVNTAGARTCWSNDIECTCANICISFVQEPKEVLEKGQPVQAVYNFHGGTGVVTFEHHELAKEGDRFGVSEELLREKLKAKGVSLAAPGK